MRAPDSYNPVSNIGIFVPVEAPPYAVVVDFVFLLPGVLTLHISLPVSVTSPNSIVVMSASLVVGLAVLGGAGFIMIRRRRAMSPGV